MAKYCYDYPRPAVAVDIAVLQWRQNRLCVLLIQRGNPPFQGQWALPGGFLDMDEELAAAAKRELQEETGLTDVPLREIGMAGKCGRDPRGRTISAVYCAIVPADRALHAQHGDDASATKWFDVRELPALAFDHVDVLASVLTYVRRGVLYFLEGLEFFGNDVSIGELGQVHEAVIGRAVSAETLGQRLVELGVLKKTDRRMDAGGETSYRVDRQRLEQIRREDLLAGLQV